MEIKVMITTPKGEASKTSKRLQPFILAAKRPDKVMVNKADNKIIWIINAPVKKCLNIQRNLMYFDAIMSNILDNKLMKKHIRSKLPPEQEQELKSLLQKQTKVEVIKEATLKEMVEANKTFWDRLKETFTEKKD